MATFKATTGGNPTSQGKKFEKFSKDTLNKYNVQLHEVDLNLTENDFSLKKKIFSLPKMEALVFSDPKLSALYEQMSNEGESRYGYHYNEMIMNILFNDYVLTDWKNLEKYKLAKPKEKKRRDKSGINQLKKKGEEMQTRNLAMQPQPKKPVTEGDEQMTKVLFLVNEKDPNDPDLFAYFPEEDGDRNGNKTAYSHVGQHSAASPAYAEESREATPEEYQDLKRELEGQGYNLEVLNGISEDGEGGAGAMGGGAIGATSSMSSGQYTGPLGMKKQVQEDDGEDYDVENRPDTIDTEGDCIISSNGWKYSLSCGGAFEGEFNDIEDALARVREWKKENHYYPNTWFINDHGNESLIDDEGNIMNETTGSGSSGAFYGPAMWGSGDLMKTKGTADVKKVPMVRGGTILEENYLINPAVFEKYVKALNEADISYQIELGKDYEQSHRGSNKGLGVNELPGSNPELVNLKDNIDKNTSLYIRTDVDKMRNDDVKILHNDMTEKNSYFPHHNNPNLQTDGIVQSAPKTSVGMWDNIKVGGEKEDSKIDYIEKESGDGYGDLENMANSDLNIIKGDLQNKKLDNPNLMAMEENINEFSGSDAVIGSDITDIQPRAGEKPFMLNGSKWEFETATYNNGKRDIVVYSYKDDIYYDYQKWREAMGIDKSMDESLFSAGLQGLSPMGFVMNYLKKNHPDIFETSDESDIIDANQDIVGTTLRDASPRKLIAYAESIYNSKVNENIQTMENINEGINQDMYSTKEDLKHLIEITKQRTGKGLTKDHIPMLAGEALFTIALQMANKYLTGKGLPVDWDELPDTNSMWNYIDENGGMRFEDLQIAVKEAVDDRISEGGFGEYGDMFNDMDESVNEAKKINEKAKSKEQQRLFGMAHAVQKGELPASKVGGAVKKIAKDVSAKDVEDFASTKHKNLPEKVDEEAQSMIGDSPDTMALKPAAVGAQSSNVDMGVRSTGGGMNEAISKEYRNDMIRRIQDIEFEIGSPEMRTFEFFKNLPDEEISRMYNELLKKSPSFKNKMGSLLGIRENKIYENLLEKINKELDAFSIHHDKLKRMAEDRKPSALVLRDRVGSENEKNFKSDLKGSSIAKVVDIENSLEWKDQQTDVPKDPYKLGADIEKQAIKTGDMKSGEALKNVGNSANDDGDEIPKRNLSNEEQDEVNLYRLGLGDLVYDNEVGKRFEDRMKADMGDKLYELRKKKLEFRAKAPMYNKDVQPTEATGVNKVQFDKEKSGWNEREGIKESHVSGKYFDQLGKKKIIDFGMNEVLELKSGKRLSELKEVNIEGMGNTYTQKVNVNEGVVKAIGGYKFFTNGRDIFALKNPVQSLNETRIKTKPVINEQMDKMKHLVGYNTATFIKQSKI